MKLSKIRIKNYRLLIDAELEVDSKTTLVVGRNNTAKTSCFSCIENALKGSAFSFNDYPLKKRELLYSTFKSYMEGSIDFEGLRSVLEPIIIEFYIDYSLDKPEDNLGALSPFIIDIDVDTTTALIRAEFKLTPDEKRIREVFEKNYNVADTQAAHNHIHDVILLNFQKLFEWSIYAVNPKNKEETQIKKHKELIDLFPFDIIPAERLLGEDENQNDTLSALISDFFHVSEDEFDPDIAKKVKELRDIVEKANRNIQEESDNVLSELIRNSIGFGYPNGEELQLGVITSLNIDEQIKNQTQLSYTTKAGEERLPGNYNGLGYKNLIKIELLLSAFARKIDNCGSACIPLLFIEEPESHMHPQMQCAFAEYLETFLKKISSTDIQVFITTHSAHIANTINFSKIRYAQKTVEGVIYKNLNTFSQSDRVNAEFIQKYLTLTKCDLFFADKAIFVEGASERLLLPDMINKCSQTGLFDSDKRQLPFQYYALIEIGGAYAHKFIPFINFLNIPSLILTDLDSVAGKPTANGQIYYSSVPVSLGATSSNETLKWWVLNNNGTKSKADNNSSIIQLAEITKMTSEDKTINKCHIEFQSEENGLCGHSLEEAIRNVNRPYYKLGDNPSEESLEFKGKCKTDFALDLIYNHSNYNIPKYIKSGLKWLNDQKVLD